jgi:hypothetical protein
LKEAIMRPLYLAIPVSLLLVASNAHAQSTNYPVTNEEAISTVQVTAPPHAVRVSDYQTRTVSGAYALSNGWRLHVRPALNGVVAAIDDQKPMRLIALSPDKYVSRDGNVAMEFNRGPDGDDMIMSYVPNDGLAQVVVVTATVASR